MKDTAKKRTTARKNELRAAVLSLVEFCPIDECNPEECPLHKVRKLKRPERLEWLSALSEDDLAHLTAYHHVCLNLKLALKT
jgi:hypothetical protein